MFVFPTHTVDLVHYDLSKIVELVILVELPQHIMLGLCLLFSLYAVGVDAVQFNLRPLEFIIEHSTMVLQPLECEKCPLIPRVASWQLELEVAEVPRLVTVSG